jgi:hypothetical protein
MTTVLRTASLRTVRPSLVNRGSDGLSVMSSEAQLQSSKLGAPNRRRSCLKVSARGQGNPQ